MTRKVVVTGASGASAAPAPPPSPAASAIGSPHSREARWTVRGTTDVERRATGTCGQCAGRTLLVVRAPRPRQPPPCRVPSPPRSRWPLPRVRHRPCPAGLGPRPAANRCRSLHRRLPSLTRDVPVTLLRPASGPDCSATTTAPLHSGAERRFRSRWRGRL